MHLVPDATEYEHHLAGQRIQDRGWALGAVMAGGGTPGWLYTVGLYQTFGHPELIVFGLPMAAGSMFEVVVDRIAEGHELPVDEPTDAFFVGSTAVLRPVNLHWYRPFVPLTTWFYGSSQPPMLQILWRDTQGRLPWEKGCERWTTRRQPLLYHDKVRRARLTALLRSLRWPLEDAPS